MRWSSRLHAHRSFLALATRDDALATQLTFVSMRYESAAHVVRPRRRVPAHCSGCPTNMIRGCTTSCFDRRVAAARDEQRARTAAASRSADPFMEQLHVAMSVVGGQAAREIATPALPQRVARPGCPGSGQGRCGARAAATHQPAARAAARGRVAHGRDRRNRQPSSHTRRFPRPDAELRGSRQCRRLPLRRALRRSARRDMHRPWCRWVRIVSAVRALHRA